ncbi:MAG: hypothetical protein M3O71_01385 [Bacteroidota bacterium]|nr:hypothetical protein [Bacteroidota bacterium]
MKQALTYSLKVWLTVLLITPIPLMFFNEDKGRTYRWYATQYLWGFVGELMVFSISIALFVWYTAWANKKPWTIKNKKAAIFALSEITFLLNCGPLLAYMVHTNSYDKQFFWSCSAYALVIGCGIFLYQLQQPKNKIAVQSQ